MRRVWWVLALCFVALALSAPGMAQVVAGGPFASVSARTGMVTANGGGFAAPWWALKSPGFEDGGLAADGINGFQFRVLSENEDGGHGGGIALDSSDEFGSVLTLALLTPQASLGYSGVYTLTIPTLLKVTGGSLMVDNSLFIGDGAGSNVEAIQAISGNVVYGGGSGYRAFTGNTYIGSGSKLRLTGLSAGGTAGDDPDAMFLVKDGNTEILSHQKVHRFKNHNAYSGSAEFHTSAAVQTSDATQTQLTSWGLGQDESCTVEVRVGGKIDGTNTARAGYFIVGHIYRNGTGNATIQGQTAVSTIESNAAWDATLTVTGTVFRVSVTGAAATTINWVGYITLHCVTDNL